jgi:hypothetical protein
MRQNEPTVSFVERNASLVKYSRTSRNSCLFRDDAK